MLCEAMPDFPTHGNGVIISARFGYERLGKEQEVVAPDSNFLLSLFREAAKRRMV
jgi:hypothetical protein